MTALARDLTMPVRRPVMLREPDNRTSGYPSMKYPRSVDAEAAVRSSKLPYHLFRDPDYTLTRCLLRISGYLEGVWDSHMASMRRANMLHHQFPFPELAEFVNALETKGERVKFFVSVGSPTITPNKSLGLIQTFGIWEKNPISTSYLLREIQVSRHVSESESLLPRRMEYTAYEVTTEELREMLMTLIATTELALL